jgi:hypothetical protein
MMWQLYFQNPPQAKTHISPQSVVGFYWIHFILCYQRRVSWWDNLCETNSFCTWQPQDIGCFYCFL